VQPLPEFACADKVLPARHLADVKIPKLMKIYLAYGAKICGGPAIDRQFMTIDYLGLIDVKSLDEKTYSYFFR
jgi:putative hemolysin